MCAHRYDLEHYDWLTRALFRLECFLSRFADLIIVNSRAGLTTTLRKIQQAEWR